MKRIMNNKNNFLYKLFFSPSLDFLLVVNGRTCADEARRDFDQAALHSRPQRDRLPSEGEDRQASR